MKNKRIVFCINSLDKGGAERVVSILANHFSKLNEVYIITITDNKIEYELEENIKLIKLVNKKNIIGSKIIKKISLFPKFVIRTIKLRKVLNEISADVIISFLPEASFMTLIANNRKTKIIISDRNDPKIEYKNIIYNYFVHKLYPKADGFVFQTINAKKYFDNFIDFKSKFYDIIFNPVNPKFIRSRYNGIRKKCIVSVGRLTQQKNFDLLIDSFKDVSDFYPEYKLMIFGDGNLKNHLSEKIKKLNLENKIIMRGVINNIQEEIYDSSLFIMTSDYEGMPNSLIEAMCLGLPVISTDCPCGGPRMLIENDINGLLVDVGNRKQLSKSIKKIIDNYEYGEKLGKNAIRIIDKVNPVVINIQWENLINKVIGG